MFSATFWAACATALAWAFPFKKIFDRTASFLPADQGEFQFSKWAWLAGAAGYMVMVWGLGGAAAQRSGYQLSWRAMVSRGIPWGDRLVGLIAGQRDPGELLYPAKNLKLDRAQYCMNVVLWVVTLLLKVAFEYFFIIWPLTEVMLEVGGWG
jgi:hypothetical protein